VQKEGAFAGIGVPRLRSLRSLRLIS